MKEILNIGVATTSKDKIEGIKVAFEEFFPDIEVKIFPMQTNSGVKEQPFGRETFQGATNRLINLKDILTKEGLLVDYYVSCEAGIDNESIPGAYFSEQVICIYNKMLKKSFFGKSSAWSIPPEDIQEIIDTDLDQYLRRRGYTGLQDIAGKGNYITRSIAVKEGVEAALASEGNYMISQSLRENRKDPTDVRY